MKRQKKRWWAWILALTLATVNTETAGALVLNAQQPKPGQEAGERVYEVNLDTVTIAAGEERSYLTINPSLADNPYAKDYYPGELTVEFTGPVTVAAGGVLSIGRLTVGGPEPSPVLRGELSPEGLIRVEAGGVLWLNGVTPEFSGSGLAIVQEPGAIVEILDTSLNEELCRWGGAVADNRYAAKEEIALVQGEPLEASLLPAEGRVWRNEKGKSEYCRLPMEWDTSAIGEQTEGTAVVPGTYLDAGGQSIPALLPVEAYLRWYAPEEIILTETSWMGSSAATARLGYQPLPEEAEEIWGELSRDGGKTWEHWEDCYFDDDNGYLSCIFVLSDATPRQYRLVATDWEEKRIWRSEAVSLPEESDQDDSGGNRGGSTDPAPPSREPEPYEEDPENTDEWEPAPAQTPRPTPAPPQILPPAVMPAPTPEPSQALPPADIPAPTPEPVAAPLEISERPPEPSETPGSPLPPLSKRIAASEQGEWVVALAMNHPSPQPTAAAEAHAAALPAAEKPVTVTPSVVEEPVAMPEVTATSNPTLAAEPLPTEPAVPAEEARQESALAPGLQALLAAAGLAFCVLVGVLAVRGRALRKRT